MIEDNNGDQNSQSNEQQQEPSWWIDEGKPGVGERPDWLSPKFRTAADLAKSYSELEKRVGTAPEEYDFTRVDWVDPEYEGFKDLQKVAKDKRVPKDVMDKVLDTFDSYFSEGRIDPKAELAKLGDNAQQRIEVLNNWAQSNLSEDAFNVLTSSIKTADGIKALEEIRSRMMDNNTQIPGQGSSDNTQVSLEEVQAELQNNLERYKTDPKYRKELEAKIRLAAGNSPFTEKHA